MPEEVVEVIALVHERDEMLTRLAVLDQLLAQRVIGARATARAPALPAMPAASRSPPKPATAVRERGSRCGKCEQHGHNARTCGRTPKKPRADKDDSEPDPAWSVATGSSSAAARVLASEHYPFVEKVARRMARRLPKHVDFSELVSAGAIGLMEAAGRFDPERHERFEAFAEFRIRGAILDDIRMGDTLSRDMRKLSNTIRDEGRRLEAELGRAPDPEELARGLGITVTELYARQKRLSGSFVESTVDVDGEDILDRTVGDAAFEDPFDSAARRETIAVIAGAVERLRPRERQVISLLYSEGITMREIGKILDVTESRVCQIHAEAVRRLRDELGQDFAGEVAA